ncbi:heterogeneous nuclear ribonucleoprotein 27C-like [Pollicipes pollicipes]|uniref:heterogeneous nuclear ribonucleoprotein 27C-like n=1 Tax=Pollicipes pollicipes TaxID=41117 RepID=UPI001884CD4B|nr:heterogeneous nuclear ribonucleoprotein 27C-like [Pollicipes pollicipes]
MRPKMMRRGKNDDNEEAGKMFVGGLSWETTQDTMLAYFSHWGEVVDCVVMKNNETGRSRGFGFVTFADPENVQRVLAEGPHELDGRTIDPKACNPRSLQNKLRMRSQTYPKVFLGGLPPSVTETDLRNFFGHFGHVMEVVIMYDQEKRKSRGFGFLSFEHEDAVERVLSKHYVNICGKQVEVKLAEPREANKQDGQPMQITPGDTWRPPQEPAHWGMPGVPVRPRADPAAHWGMPQQLAAGGHGVAPMPAGGMPSVMQWSQQQQPFPQQQFAPPAAGPPQGYPAGWAPPQGGWATYGQPPPHQYSQFPPQTAAPAPVLAAQKQPDYAGWQQQYGLNAGFAPEYAGARPVQAAPQHQEMAAPGPQMQGYASYPGSMSEVINYGQPGGPGPQRGGNYNQPVQAQLYHPYRHSPYAARR